MNPHLVRRIPPQINTFRPTTNHFILKILYLTTLNLYQIMLISRGNVVKNHTFPRLISAFLGFFQPAD